MDLKTETLDALKADASRLATEQAFDLGRPCEHCAGRGTVPGGDKTIHSYAGPFGADWNLASVLETIRDAKDARWLDGSVGHDLGVLTSDDRVVRFAVTRAAADGSV